MAWTRGSLALASWTSIAPTLGLTLLLPRAAPAEALLVRPADAALFDLLLAEPAVVVVDTPEPRHRAEIDDLYDRGGVFDPLAAWVVALCRARAWPAMTSDPVRLRRLDPTLELHEL